MMMFVGNLFTSPQAQGANKHVKKTPPHVTDNGCQANQSDESDGDPPAQAAVISIDLRFLDGASERPSLNS